MRVIRNLCLSISLCISASGFAREPDNALDLKTLDAELRLIMGSGQVPAMAIGIVHDGRTVFSRALGTRAEGSGLAIDDQTRFRMASVSKTMSAALVGKLVEQGFLKWDTPVTLLVPSFQLKDRNYPFLTVEQLLSHRTGLKHHTLDDELEAVQEFSTIRPMLNKVQPLCRIGDCFAYQNVTFSFSADIVQAVSGRFFEEEMRRQLFEPLEMTRANIGLEALSEDDNWARPHLRVWKRGLGGVNEVVGVKPNYYWLPASAGVNASLSDMTQWVAALLGQRTALSKETVKELTRVQAVTPAERLGVEWRRERLRYASYGLGIRIFDYLGHPVYFHAGAVQGYRSMVVVVPERKAGFVLMWNSHSGLPAGLVPTLLDRWFNVRAPSWVRLN
jgi:beta-lactamase class C